MELREAFVKIFLEEGLDEEWALIIYGRWFDSGEPFNATEIRQAAKEWKQYGDEGGF